MKYLVCSDLHIRIGGRLDDIESALSQIFAIAQAENVDKLLILGDSYESRRPHSQERLIFDAWIQKFRDRNIKVVILIGNHDSYPNGVHAFSEFAMLNIDDVLVFHSPFVYDNIFLGHMLLREAQIGPTDFRKLDEMSLDELVAKYPGCRAYLLGDVHKYQVLHNAPLVMYSGSVVPVDFGERNDVKGVTILQVDFRPNHPPGIWGGAYALSTGGDLHWKFISLKTRPMIQYVYECNKRAFVEFSCPATENYVSEAIVKVILRGTKEQLTQTDEKAMRDLFTAAKELYLEYDIIKDTRSRDERVNETVSAAQALELYLEKQDMPHEQRTRVLDLGKQIIDGVKTDA